MHKIIKARFINKYWLNIVQIDNGFALVNTHRGRKMSDRDGIEKVIEYFNTREEAENRLKEYEKGKYTI